MQPEFPDEPPTSVTGAVLRQARVLVVDDDEDLLAWVACALRADGHVVLESHDAFDALTRLSSMMLAGLGEPDVIVTDARMPRGGGATMINGARMRGCKSPIVLMTAHRASLSEQSAWLDVTHILDKPLDIDELRTTVRRLTVK
jgi:DNA-binding response OmpR family regulator